jgi:hypothetical protein
MKIWVDDVRQAPEGYVWCKTSNEAKAMITCMVTMHRLEHTENLPVLELIDLDHDAGDYAVYGGDYIEVLKFMEKNGINFPIRIHSMNPVGVENMRRIIQKNGWTEVK